MGVVGVGEAPAGLLATKLHAPRRRRGVVDRPRLLGRLAAGADRPALTLVSAPAGFGKTTLLGSWLAGEPRPAWLSLDAADDEPVRFWTYVLAALRSVAPAVGESAGALLAAGPGSIEPALAALLNDLDALDDPLALVIDDYHVIGSPAIHEQVSFLVDHLPPSVRLAIGTRSDPPLPLARLRASGDLVEVRVADLRFTVDEATAYLNDSMGLALSPEDVATLDDRTEGWIAALQLAALSMRDRDDVAGFIAGFAGDDRFVVDYLAEEVLARQPDDIRDFLLRTSLLARLTGPLCDAVTGGRDGTARLEALDRANLFLVPLDDRRTWYRYHHLFGDVLQARLLHERPDAVRDLHRRASAWLADHGDRPAAITHALRGHDHDRAAGLIELALPQMRRTRQEVTLRRWLDQLPDAVFVDRPVLTEALVGARMATGDPRGVEPLLQRIEEWIDGRDGRTPTVVDDAELARLPAQVAIYRAALALLAGDTRATISHAERALASVAASDQLGRGSAAALVGLAHWASGDLDAAGTHYAEAVEALAAAGHRSDALGCSLARSDIQLAQGRLGDAERTLRDGLRLAADTPGLRGSADMHVGLCEVLLERGDLRGARTQLEAARALGEHAGLPQHPYRWRVAAGRLHAAAGDPDAALELLAEAARLYDTDFSPSVRPVPALAARVHLAAGHRDAAARWARDSGLGADDELSYVREFEHVTLARLLVAQGDEAAPGFVQRLLAAADAGGRALTAVELLVLQSTAADARGDRSVAVAAIEDALVRAEPEGLVQVFAQEGAAVAGLLRTVPAGSPAAAHARRVLAMGEGEPPPVRRQPGLVDELSSRERDVLRLLRSELNGPDIARELHVSLNTMRTHTKNIYAKLGATNRREAVRRADELGL